MGQTDRQTDRPCQCLADERVDIASRDDCDQPPTQTATYQYLHLYLQIGYIIIIIIIIIIIAYYAKAAWHIHKTHTQTCTNIKTYKLKYTMH